MGEKPAGGFNVVVITGDTGFMEPMELFCAEKSHGSAQINPAFPMHGFKGMNGLVKFAAGQCPSGSHNGKTIHTLGFMHFASLKNVLFRQKIIDLAVGMVVGGLGTANSELVELLGLEPHKAVILSVMRENRVEEAMNCLEEKFNTIRNGKGICFAVPLSSVIGVNLYQFLSDNRMGREASL